MPTVPSVDTTAMPADNYTAPGVAPVRNAAPEQLQNLGQVAQQAGTLEMRTGATIGDRVQEVVDGAQTKSAETAALKSAQDILYNPQSGYFTQQGKAAVDGYEPTNQAVTKAFQDQLDGLSNPVQKQAFQQVMQAHLLSFGKQTAIYNHGQTSAWAASESKSRSESYQILAAQNADSRYQKDADGNAIGDFAKYTKQMEGEVIHAAALAGFDPDSAQAKSMLREQYTALNHAMISNMLDNHDAYGAKKWFDEQSAAGNIDLRNLSTLGNAVKGAYDQQKTIDLASEAVSASLSPTKSAPVTLAMPVPGSSINVTSGLGDTRANGRSHDGIDIAVPVGTQVMSPASGKVSKVWNDDKFGGGLSVEVTLANGMTAGFAHLSAANVHEGDELQQGTTLGLSGKTGNATGPVLHYMMKDQDGKYVDPRQVSQPQPNKEGISDPDAAEKARQYIMDSDASPEVKKAAIAQVQTQHAQYRELENQRQTATFKRASDYFYRGGEKFGSIPPSVAMQLTPEQQQKFKDEDTGKVLRDYSQGQQFKEMGSVDLQAFFIQNPKMLTAENVDAARPKLSNSDYLALQHKAQEFKTNPQGVVEAQGVNEQIKYLAGHAGYNVEPKTPADKQTMIDITARVSQDIAQIKTQNNGKATQEQVQKAIQQELIRRTAITPRSPWNPMALVSPNKTVTLPLGAVTTARGSDGKDHYLDRLGVDLGPVN